MGANTSRLGSTDTSNSGGAGVVYAFASVPLHEDWVKVPKHDAMRDAWYADLLAKKRANARTAEELAWVMA